MIHIKAKKKGLITFVILFCFFLFFHIMPTFAGEFLDKPQNDEIREYNIGGISIGIGNTNADWTSNRATLTFGLDEDTYIEAITNHSVIMDVTQSENNRTEEQKSEGISPISFSLSKSGVYQFTHKKQHITLKNLRQLYINKLNIGKGNFDQVEQLEDNIDDTYSNFNQEAAMTYVKQNDWLNTVYANLTYKLDVTPPEVPTVNLIGNTTHRDENGVEWTKNARNFQITGGEDAHSGKDYLAYGIDGSLVTYSPPFQVARSTTGISEVIGYSVDKVGNYSWSFAIKVGVDQENPINPTLVMDENWTKEDRKFTITGGSDAHSGLKHREYKIDNGPWTVYSNETIARSITGESKVYVRSVDNVGNKSDPEGYRTARVDKEKPIIKFNPDGGDFSGPETNITRVQVTDKHSGVDEASLYYIWSAQNKTAPDQGWTNFQNNTYIPKVDSLGDFYLWIKAKDIAGNENVVRSQKFYIDNKVVKLNIEPVHSSGNKLLPVMGYVKENSSNFLKLSNIETNGENIVFRDDNTGNIRFEEKFIDGFKSEISREENFSNVFKHELLKDVPTGYSGSGNSVKFVRINYYLKKETPLNGITSQIKVWYERPNGVVTNPQYIDFTTWSTPRDKDTN
jgi:hypothetical protein